jgi:hypothetical protein
METSDGRADSRTPERTRIAEGATWATSSIEGGHGLAMNKAPRSSSPLAARAFMKRQPPITQRSRRGQQAHLKEARLASHEHRRE